MALTFLSSLVRSVWCPESASAASALAAGPVAEQVLILENIGTSVQASEDQLPSVYRLLHEAAAMLCMDPPDLYIRQVGEFCDLYCRRPCSGQTRQSHMVMLIELMGLISLLPPVTRIAVGAVLSGVAASCRATIAQEVPPCPCLHACRTPSRMPTRWPLLDASPSSSCTQLFSSSSRLQSCR